MKTANETTVEAKSKRLLSIELTFDDLNKIAQEGLLEKTIEEFPSECMHHGCRVYTFKRYDKVIYSFEQTYGYGIIGEEIIEIKVDKDLYFEIESISDKLESFKPFKYAYRFFFDF